MSKAEPQIPPYYYQDDEITLKELILKVRDFWKELWKNWITIVLTGLLVAAGFYYRATKAKTTYTAAISFMVNQNNTSSGVQGYNPYTIRQLRKESNNKITELTRSGKIIHEVLLERTVLDNRSDYLGNHIIDIYDLNERWDKEPLVEEYKELHLKGFRLTREEVEAFSKKELRALSILHELLSGNKIVAKKGFMNITYGDETDIFRLNVKTKHETLSMRIVEQVFSKLEEFYTHEAIGKPKQAHEKLRIQVDSLNSVQRTIEGRLASARDRNRGTITSFASISIQQLNREFLRISSEYDNAYKNMKSFELILSQETPEFNIIDQTFFPIENAPSRLKAILLGGFIGGTLASFFLLIRKVVREALAED